MQELQRLIADSINELKTLTNKQDLESMHVKVRGKNGYFPQVFSKLSTLANEEKKEVAKQINILKKEFEKIFQKQHDELESIELDKCMREDKIDSSLFQASVMFSRGHPIHRMKDIIIEYFTSMNFSLQDGPFIEDDFHNFEALNIPKYHPARDMQDTFYFQDSMLLRTHTSPTQIRTMQSTKPPIRMICMGATFRRDYDLTHSPMFHQCEGLVVENGDHISFAHLKDALEKFVKHIFGSDVKVRFRASFFPFTEPSAEVDISCMFCKGSGCRVCSFSGFLEVLGCGVVNHEVFKAVGYENVSGYAFGLGIERLAMLKWGINDLRSFYETDLRILEQF